MRVSASPSSTAIEQPARRTRVQCVLAAWANKASLPVLRVHDAASMTVSFRHTTSAVIPRLVRTGALGRGIQYAAATRWTTGFSGILDHPPQCASAHKAGDDGSGLRKQALPGLAAAAGRARLLRCKTQYKCGNSRFWNNHPLGKPGYDQRLSLAPPYCFRWSERAAEAGPSNGAHMLVPSAADGSPTTPAIRAMEWPLKEAFPAVGLKA